MKSYIVRVYPAGGSGTSNTGIVGIVEDPETGDTTKFHDSAELWAIVSRGPAVQPARREKQVPKKNAR